MSPLRKTTPESAAHESLQETAAPNISSAQMRGRLLPILAACVLSVLGVTAGSASAAMVTVFGHNGRTHVVNNRFLSGPGTSAYLPSAPVTWPLLQPVGDPL